jgi:hypothetical protein
VIRTLHWDEVGDVEATAWVPASGGRAIVLLPGPANRDLCLREAGLDDFGDPDDQWESDFVALVRRSLELGACRGEPRLADGGYPVRDSFWSRLLCRQPPPSLIDAVLAAARDDNFRPCRIEFGVPAEVALRSAHGHHMLWLWERVPERSAEETVSLLAGWRTQRSRLKWKGLA